MSSSLLWFVVGSSDNLCDHGSMIIEEVDGDVLDQPVDAIVNAWNRNISAKRKVVYFL